MSTLRPSVRTLVIAYLVVCVVRLVTLPFSPTLGAVTTWMASPLLIEAALVAGSTPHSALLRFGARAYGAILAAELSLIHLTGPAKDLTTAAALLALTSAVILVSRRAPHQGYDLSGGQTAWVYWILFAALTAVALTTGSGPGLLPVIAAGAALTWALPRVSDLGMRAYFGSFLLLIGCGLLASSPGRPSGTVGLAISGLALLNTGMLLVFLDVLVLERKTAHDRRTTAASQHRSGFTPPDVAAAQVLGVGAGKKGSA